MSSMTDITVAENLSGYITTREAAQLLGRTPRHAAYLCSEGFFPNAVKMGRDWLIPRDDVTSYQPGPQGFAAVKARKEKKI